MENTRKLWIKIWGIYLLFIFQHFAFKDGDLCSSFSVSAFEGLKCLPFSWKWVLQMTEVLYGQLLKKNRANKLASFSKKICIHMVTDKRKFSSFTSNFHILTALIFKPDWRWKWHDHINWTFFSWTDQNKSNLWSCSAISF